MSELGAALAQVTLDLRRTVELEQEAASQPWPLPTCGATVAEDRLTMLPSGAQFVEAVGRGVCGLFRRRLVPDRPATYDLVVALPEFAPEELIMRTVRCYLPELAPNRPIPGQSVFSTMLALLGQTSAGDRVALERLLLIPVGAVQFDGGGIPLTLEVR